MFSAYFVYADPMSMMYTFLSLLYPIPSKRDIFSNQHTNNLFGHGKYVTLLHNRRTTRGRYSNVIGSFKAIWNSRDILLYTHKKLSEQNAIRFHQHTDSIGSAFFCWRHYMFVKTMSNRLEAELKSPLKQTNLSYLMFWTRVLDMLELLNMPKQRHCRHSSRR